ncbi:MAG: MT-A70 family methyltransferase [Cyanobacteria bacterium P01_A01_bin.37]
MTHPFPNGKYGIIYADPPWTYRDKCNAGKRGVSHKYDVMDLEAICALPVQAIAADDCLLAMWWVPPMPMEALRVAAAWGFTFKTMKGFTWEKVSKNGKHLIGMGSYTRANTEDCLFAVRGKPKRIDAGVRQFIQSERREHSQKPDEVRDRLVQLMGNVPRIELFARNTTPGWHAWGNEIAPF